MANLNDRPAGDDLEGKATHLGGKLKEGLGDLLGDNRMKEDGRLDQMKGEAQQDASRAEQELLNAREREMAAERAKRL